MLCAQADAFVQRLNAYYPPDASGLSIAQNRRIYDRMCRAFHAGRPEGLQVETQTIPADDHAVPIRIYRRERADPAAVLLYFHGGGFVLGGLESHDDICAELCEQTGFETVSVDYRLAPEWLGTAALQDCAVALEWLWLRHHRPVIVVGESAGGNLAACLSHQTRHKPVKPAGQILVYPALGGDTTTGSYVTHAHAPLLSTKDVIEYAGVRTPRTPPRDDPRFTPLAARDYTYLPPTSIFTAECDPLASDGPAYRDRLEADNVPVSLFEGLGLPHGYLRGRHSIDAAIHQFNLIVQEITRIARLNDSG